MRLFVVVFVGVLDGFGVEVCVGVGLGVFVWVGVTEAVRVADGLGLPLAPLSIFMLILSALSPDNS